MVRWLGLPVLALVMVAASLALTTREAAADPRDFTLVNASATTVTHVYVQETGPGDDWGDDILGADVLPAGSSVFIYFTRFTPDNCFYDVRVVSADGSEAELVGIDLCATDTITYS